MRRRLSSTIKSSETKTLPDYKKTKQRLIRSSLIWQRGLISWLAAYANTLACITLVGWVLMLLHQQNPTVQTVRQNPIFHNSVGPPAIQFTSHFVSDDGFYRTKYRGIARPNYGSYGGLDISFHIRRGRRIDSNDWEVLEDERADLLDDSTFARMEQRYQNDEDLVGEQKCYRNNWKSKSFPVCNNFHEMSLERLLGPFQGYDISYLGHGHFRDAWKFEKYPDEGISSFVIKKLRLNHVLKVDHASLAEAQKEAIIMERLTASPRIVDIYGLCGMSILLESMQDMSTKYIIGSGGRMTQASLDRIQTRVRDVVPQNKLTLVEKLDWAISMAESIADIHGFKGGMIRHGDLQPDQWLISSTGTLKLNDFNLADIFDYSREKSDYCKVWACNRGTGTYSPPEELLCKNVNEGIDTYRMGNNIYTLLTGLWPFYGDEVRGQHKNDEMNKDIQLKPYVDPRYRIRSMIEGKLVEIMERCWEWHYEKRISIFEVIEFLRQVKEEYESEESQD